MRARRRQGARERSKRRRREDAAVVFVGRGLDVGVGRGLHGGNFAHEFARVRAPGEKRKPDP